jgi:hypothetical protein
MREAAALPALTDYIEFNQKLLPVFLIARQRWDEALVESRRLASGRFPATRAVGEALAGHALFALGRPAEARAALAAAERALGEVPGVAGGIAMSGRQVQPWIDTLRGELLLRDGKRDEGRRVLQDVARTLRAIPGPDAWIQALFRLEAIARLARETGAAELAGFMAGQMVEHDAAYGGSHLALALASEQQGDAAQADRARAEALRYWRDADADLPELALARGARAAR